MFCRSLSMWGRKCSYVDFEAHYLVCLATICTCSMPLKLRLEKRFSVRNATREKATFNEMHG